MTQAERRGKAVLAAAVEFARLVKESNARQNMELIGGPALDLIHAVEKYEEATKALANIPEDPTAFVCPHCGEVRPGYGWNYNAGDTGPFAVCYLTAFCGACKGILSICVTTFQPSEEMAKALMDQFKKRLVNPS